MVSSVSWKGLLHDPGFSELQNKNLPLRVRFYFLRSLMQAGWDPWIGREYFMIPAFPSCKTKTSGLAWDFYFSFVRSCKQGEIRELAGSTSWSQLFRVAKQKPPASREIFIFSSFAHASMANSGKIKTAHLRWAVFVLLVNPLGFEPRTPTLKV